MPTSRRFCKACLTQRVNNLPTWTIGSKRPPSRGPQKANPHAAWSGPAPRDTKGASWLPRLKVRDRAQKLLFERHEKYFPDTSIPLLYRPKDTRRQNIMVAIPGLLLDDRPDQQELVLNDVVEVPLKYAPIADPQEVRIIDDYLQWSNLAYLAVLRVKYLSQLERVVCPPPPRRRAPVRHYDFPCGVFTDQHLKSNSEEASGLQATGPSQGAQV